MDTFLPTTPGRRRLLLSVFNGWALGMTRSLTLAAPLVAAGLVPHVDARAAQTTTESRDVSGFSEVVFAAAGELVVKQGQRERLTIEAEPEILRKITSEVRGKRLTLAFAAGSVVAREPIRFRLDVRDLRVLELRTAGSVHIGPLNTADLSLIIAGSGDIDVERLTGTRLEARIDGSGTISIVGGEVDALRIALGGAGAVKAKELASRSAEVSIDGSGDVVLNASERLSASIGGSGSVRYSGRPSLSQSITGAGTIKRD